MILIAGANLLDPNFSRAVIFLCEHRDEGSFGLVLNQPLSLNVRDIVPTKTAWDAPLFRGGPVQENTLHYIHRSTELAIGSHEVLPGIFWGGDFDALNEQVAKNKIALTDIRFFIGYSGWGEGQLIEEIKRDSWYLHKAGTNMIFFEDSRNHWRKIFKSMGNDYSLLSNFPDDPRLN